MGGLDTSRVANEKMRRQAQKAANVAQTVGELKTEVALIKDRIKTLEDGMVSGSIELTAVPSENNESILSDISDLKDIMIMFGDRLKKLEGLPSDEEPEVPEEDAGAETEKASDTGEVPEEDPTE